MENQDERWRCASCDKSHQTWSAAEMCCLKIGIKPSAGQPKTGAYVNPQKAVERTRRKYFKTSINTGL